MSDTKARSWAKSIIWRIIGIIIMPIIILFVYACIGKDSAIVATWSTVIFHSIRVVMYYFHERIWESIKWGKQ